MEKAPRGHPFLPSCCGYSMRTGSPLDGLGQVPGAWEVCGFRCLPSIHSGAAQRHTEQKGLSGKPLVCFPGLQKADIYFLTSPSLKVGL